MLSITFSSIRIFLKIYAEFGLNFLNYFQSSDYHYTPRNILKLWRTNSWIRQWRVHTIVWRLLYIRLDAKLVVAQMVRSEEREVQWHLSLCPLESCLLSNHQQHSAGRKRTAETSSSLDAPPWHSDTRHHCGRGGTVLSPWGALTQATLSLGMLGL